MFKKFIILFLFYQTIKMCLCSHQGYVNFEIFEDANIRRFPWMVTISNINNRSTNFAYGIIIHRRVVLTLSIMEINEFSYFNFRVFAKCYFPIHVTTFHCSQGRNVNEYHILEQFKNNNKGNLAILIVSKEFKLSRAVNVIHFARHSTDFDHKKCAIIALRNLEISRGYRSKARLMTSTKVKIVTNPGNELVYKLSLKYSNLTLYDDKNRAVTFKIETDKYVIDYFGSSLICRSDDDDKRWLLIGVVNFAIVINNDKIEYPYPEEVIRVDVGDTQEILTEIIRRSLPGKKDSTSLLSIG